MILTLDKRMYIIIFCFFSASMIFHSNLISLIIIDKMFGWFSRCWGGFGVNSQFERARVRSVITDWRVPEDADLCGKNLFIKF